MLSSATVSNEISCCSFLVKNHVFCMCNSSETNFIPRPHEQESGRRQTQCSSTRCECLCTLLIWYCPLQPFQMRNVVVHFYQKSCYLCAFHISKISFITQPHEQKSCRRQTQCSSTLYGCLCNQPIWCCPLQPFQMRYFVVHFYQKSCYFFYCVPTTLAN